MSARVLVFDSGVGGLSVAREIRKALPAVEILYVADDAGFPYGERDEGELTGRVTELVGRLIETERPDAAVIACNTASTLVLPPLRARFSLPIVGTVPAIKPAAERTRSGLISVLATPGTIARDYTRGLIQSFAASCQVRLVGSYGLAGLAEAVMNGRPVTDEAIRIEFADAFVERDGRRTDHVVLACTHYPFLIDHLTRLAPWPVEWIDPAPAIARRLGTVLGAAAEGEGAPRGSAALTSGKAWSPSMQVFLSGLGLATLDRAGSPLEPSTVSRNRWTAPSS